MIALSILKKPIAASAEFINQKRRYIIGLLTAMMFLAP